MSSAWRTLSWGDIATLEYGKALRADQRITGNHPVYGTNGRIGYCETVLCNEPGIIIGRKGEYREVHYSPIPFFVIDTAFYLKKKENFDTKWAYYFLKTQDINELDSGSAIPSTSREDFYQLLVSVPPLSEQRAIAAVLSSLDDKIDLLHRQNATLEAMAEALFRQWFVVEAKEEWEEGTISLLAEQGKKSITPTKTPSQFFHVYSIPGYDAGKNPEILLGKDILSNKFVVEKFTVLISKLNPRFPRVWMLFDSIGENAISSTEFISLQPRNKNYLCFLYCLLTSWQVTQDLSNAASGTSGSHQRVRPDDILNLSFLYPSLDYIEKFSETVFPFFTKVFLNQQQIRTLEKLRDTLLPKLMSGEVRVDVA